MLRVGGHGEPRRARHGHVAPAEDVAGPGRCVLERAHDRERLGPDPPLARRAVAIRAEQLVDHAAELAGERARPMKQAGGVGRRPQLDGAVEAQPVE